MQWTCVCAGEPLKIETRQDAADYKDTTGELVVHALALEQVSTALRQQTLPIRLQAGYLTMFTVQTCTDKLQPFCVFCLLLSYKETCM